MSRSTLVFAVATMLGVACGGESAAIGPPGGLVSSEDDALTIIIWPGALGSFETFSITPSEMTPDSFGQAYRVQPNVELEVDAEVILRGDLPSELGKARIGAITPDDFADGDGEWSALPHRAADIDENEGTIHSHDDQIALYYAILDNGDEIDPTSAESSSSGGEDTSTTEDPTGVPTTSYARDIQPIWDIGCTVMMACHGAAPSGGLTLTGASYGNIVDVPATINGQPRVIPGDPDGSLLMQKIDRMPPNDGGTPMPPVDELPMEQREIVRLWIEEGCPP